MTRKVGKNNRWRLGALPSPKSTIVGFSGFCLLLIIALPAWGYVLQGPHLILLMTENLGTAQSLVVRQKLLVYDETTSNVRAEVSETLTYRFPSAFRSESTSPLLNRIHVNTLDAAITIVDEKVSFQENTLLDRYIGPLLFRSRAVLRERFSENGINPMVSSLGRFDGVPFYVLGAHYPDISLPQLWIEKETFRPVRLLIPNTDDRTDIPGLEFRYLQWQQYGKAWYPMQIQCYRNNRLIREMIVEEVVMNPLISDELFDIDRMRILYGSKDILESEIPSAETPSEIQRALDDFTKRYEEQ